MGQLLTAFPNHKSAVLLHIDNVNNLVYPFTVAVNMLPVLVICHALDID